MTDESPAPSGMFISRRAARMYRRLFKRAGRPAVGPGMWLPSALPMALFLFLPLVALLSWASPEAFIAALRQPAVADAVWLSIQTSFWTTLLAVVFGTPLAYLLARRTFPLKRLMDAFIDLPLVLPPAVAGVALLVTFGRKGLAGPLLEWGGFQIAFTPVAVVMAQLFVAAPLFIRAAVIGFSALERDMEEAALIDGAGEGHVFRRIMFPMARDALLGGAVLTWGRALGEFGATIIFAGNFPGRTQTMPLAIYLGFELDLTVAITLSVILVGVSLLTIVVVRHMLASAD